MADFIINAEGGRIGELWWFNADPATPRTVKATDRLGVLTRDIIVQHRVGRVVRWGSFGFGRDVTIKWEMIDEV